MFFNEPPHQMVQVIAYDFKDVSTPQLLSV
jgi:hypothetical protein